MRFEELVNLCDQRGLTLGRLSLNMEALETGVSPEAIFHKVMNMVRVMKDSVKEGLGNPQRRSRSGLSGGDAGKIACRLSQGRSFPGNTLLARSVAYSLAVAEVNACMGRIVAAPTAGSCGVIPGTFMALSEAQGIGDSDLVYALCAAGAVGQVIAGTASISGAESGCQAECGSAAAMAAAGLTQLGGGSPKACVHAAALAIKSLMGLVCDPVGGLVEVPCIKRNATASAIALASAEMALAGVRSKIPPDEVVSAMAAVGRLMPASLRETAQGGLAATPTGMAFKLPER